MISPMMKQYLEMKEQYPDCILFFRLGDFYEMFFDDAVKVSAELELTLTGRDCGLKERAPMCGVPYHAVDTYVARLIEKGYKVAICEQLTEPGKGLVKRDIVRIITPGTLVDNVMLKDDKNNYLVSAAIYDGRIGVAWTDISTGEFKYTDFDSYDKIKLNELLSRISPSEIICNESMLNASVELSIVKFGTVCPFTLYDESAFDYNDALPRIKACFGEEYVKAVSPFKACVVASGALLSYIERTQKRSLSHLYEADRDNDNAYMTIDYNARRTLELIESMSGGKRGSLRWILDKTKTSMGSRLLRALIEVPLNNADEINARLDAVNELYDSLKIREDLGNGLKKIYDLERLCGRLSYGNIAPKDCLSISYSLSALPLLKKSIADCKSPLIRQLDGKIKLFDEIAQHIASAIDEEAPNILRDGGVIKSGYDKQLDEYRTIKTNAKSLLTRMEQEEREETGIKNLKIAFNRVFGYYIEVSKSQLPLVPYRYIRKQTLTTGERFITEELKELEDKILNAEELALKREALLFGELIDKMKEYITDMLETAKAVAYIDVLLSFAEVAKEYKYVRPSVSADSDKIVIVEGRHPVVEKLISDLYVPNDTYLDRQGRIMLITGPNMAGKSIYMRQVALIVIMAHIGCFVPADKAEICIVDKIFTRVGASDDLNTGRSTFMVEMSEVASILQSATDKSLILLDEIGRGTSTYDGLSIAWAIIEHLSKNYSSKVLFSTHYHELTELEGILDGVKNYKLTVKELKNNIIFLRKLMRGSANRSFGIEVAALSGIKEEIIDRAKEILKKLTEADVVGQSKISSKQLSIFDNVKLSEILSILHDLNLDDLTPRNAYDILSDLKEKAESK